MFRRSPFPARPSAAPIALRHRLFVRGTSGGRAFHGRAVALAVDGPDTRYLIEDGTDRLWVGEAEIERSMPVAPGDAVVGYVTVRAAGRPGETRTPKAAIRRACEREGWRLVGFVCDDARRPVAARPGLRRALARLAAGNAAGIVVADVAAPSDGDAGLIELTTAVRRAGGGVVAIDSADGAADGPTRRAALDAASARITELRAAGMAPRAIADVLNRENVPCPGPDASWQSWSVRRAGGAWPPRGPERPHKHP
jgi:hypothetical protein